MRKQREEEDAFFLFIDINKSTSFALNTNKLLPCHDFFQDQVSMISSLKGMSRGIMDLLSSLEKRNLLNLKKENNAELTRIREQCLLVCLSLWRAKI